jgi:hypothetical protein
MGFFSSIFKTRTISVNPKKIVVGIAIAGTIIASLAIFKNALENSMKANAQASKDPIVLAATDSIGVITKKLGIARDVLGKENATVEEINAALEGLDSTDKFYVNLSDGKLLKLVKKEWITEADAYGVISTKGQIEQVKNDLNLKLKPFYK